MRKLITIIQSRPLLLFLSGMAFFIILAAVVAATTIAAWSAIAGFVLLFAIVMIALRDVLDASHREKCESDAILLGLLDATYDRIILIDRKETIIAVNDGGALPLGFTKAELIGNNLGMMLDIHQFDEWNEKLSTAILMCKPQFFTLLRGGLYYENKVQPIANADGEVVRLALFSRDVSPPKMSEPVRKDNSNYEQMVFDNMLVTMYVKDVQHRRYVIWNKCSEKLFGITADEALGKTDHELFPVKQAKAFRKKDDDLLASGKRFEVRKGSIINKTLGKINVHTIKIPIYDEQGSPIYILSFLENVTEQRKNLKALKKSEDQILKVEEATDIVS